MFFYMPKFFIVLLLCIQFPFLNGMAPSGLHEPTNKGFFITYDNENNRWHTSMALPRKDFIHYKPLSFAMSYVSNKGHKYYFNLNNALNWIDSDIVTINNDDNAEVECDISRIISYFIIKEQLKFEEQILEKDEIIKRLQNEIHGQRSCLSFLNRNTLAAAMATGVVCAVGLGMLYYNWIRNFQGR